MDPGMVQLAVLMGTLASGVTFSSHLLRQQLFLFISYMMWK